jgi:DNA-directed RNA polymerase sigma subunit (sigma70/sigma32)
VELRFGLRDGRERTLAEIAAELHVTTSRAGPVLAQALRKLRRDRIDGPSRTK